MSGKLKNDLDRIEIDIGSCPPSGTLMAICESTEGKISGPQLILIYRTYFVEESEIEIENDWLSSENRIKHYWQSERKQKKIQQKLYSQYSSETDNTADINIKAAKYSYQQTIHTAFEELRGKIKNVDYVRITATILGSRTKTTLLCQYQDSDNSDGDKLIKQIAESFNYDAGYEFGSPNANRTDSHTRTMKRAKNSLMQICILSPVMFVGLFFFRIVSGARIPVIGMAVATISGGLFFQIASWLAWQVGFMAGYGLHS